MDCTTEISRYRSVYKHLRIGKREYAVLDKDAAQERAIFHLQEAKRLLTTELDEQVHILINQELLVATDFGSPDAPFLLALRILEPTTHTNFPPAESIVFLKIAADRGHAESAYRIATCYACYGKYKSLEAASAEYMAGFSLSDRRRLSVLYFEQAIEGKSQVATEDLIMAFAYGRGLILQDAHKLQTLCERLVAANNRTVALGYAAWLVGLTVKGESLLDTCVKLPADPQKALDLLLYVACGPELQLAQHALLLFCVGLGKEGWQQAPELLAQRLLKLALAGNQLLAIYIAWYSLPMCNRAKLPALFANYELSGLEMLFEPCEELALQCLNQALIGVDEDISNLAREVLYYVFGKFYLTEDGQLDLSRLQAEGA